MEENLFPLAQVSSQTSCRLACQWVNPETGSQCDVCYEKVDELLAHIKSAHYSNLDSNHSSNPGVCLWKFCSYSSAHLNEFKCHVLFHGYHSFLKTKGEELINQKSLPSCQMDSEVASSRVAFPKTNHEEGWSCRWFIDKTQTCGLMFSCAKTFYDHVKIHVEDSRECKCYWEGIRTTIFYMHNTCTLFILFKQRHNVSAKIP